MGYLKLDNDQALYYELIEGKSDKPYLVFLHDGLGCTAGWKNFPRQLCGRTGCPGLIYDRIGYGFSSPLQSVPTVHHMHDYALKELPALINHILPGRPHILIGHSDGGSIALIYGARRNPLVKGIVTEAAHVFVEPETLEGIRQIVDAFERGKLKRLALFHGEKTDQIFKAWSGTWLSPDFRDWNLEPLLPFIECPVLVIQGRDDQFGTDRQVDSIASNTRSSVEPNLISDCGHSPHLEQSEIVIEKIMGFIDDHRLLEP